MRQRPPVSAPDATGLTPEGDVGVAIDRLFEEIANQSDNPLLQTSLSLLREETERIRAYEADLLPDREAEYQRLLACWRRRDKVGLHRELTAYFKRRQDIAEQVAKLMDRPN